MNWTPCPAPAVGDTIRWKEPVWAAPTQKRGKPDQIGEQMLTAQVVSIGDVVGLQVKTVEVLSLNPGAQPPAGVKPGDHVRRKPSTIERGECQKQA